MTLKIFVFSCFMIKLFVKICIFILLVYFSTPLNADFAVFFLDVVTGFDFFGEGPGKERFVLSQTRPMKKPATLFSLWFSRYHTWLNVMPHWSTFQFWPVFVVKCHRSVLPAVVINCYNDRLVLPCICCLCHDPLWSSSIVVITRSCCHDPGLSSYLMVACCSWSCPFLYRIARFRGASVQVPEGTRVAPNALLPHVHEDLLPGQPGWETLLLLWGILIFLSNDCWFLPRRHHTRVECCSLLLR